MKILLHLTEQASNHHVVAVLGTWGSTGQKGFLLHPSSSIICSNVLKASAQVYDNVVELRFIISSIPVFNFAAAVAAGRLYNNRKKSFWKFLYIAMLGLILGSLACTAVFFMASYENYPSGYALKALHRIGLHMIICTHDVLENGRNLGYICNFSRVPAVFGNSHPLYFPAYNVELNLCLGGVTKNSDELRVHIDTFSAMNGISRFCEYNYPWSCNLTSKIAPLGIDCKVLVIGNRSDIFSFVRLRHYGHFPDVERSRQRRVQHVLTVRENPMSRGSHVGSILEAKLPCLLPPCVDLLFMISSSSLCQSLRRCRCTALKLFPSMLDKFQCHVMEDNFDSIATVALAPQF
uniref:Mannosyltransferase n=1 Tax=Solanum lycopersicum TaxID=4081 RepID=A0A3Q7EKC0_SOLLC